MAPLPVPAGPVSDGDLSSGRATAPPDADQAARPRNPNRLLWCALVSAIALLAAATLLTG